MTIHHTDPFATPEGQRSPVRRLRARLPAPVTLWTAGPAAGSAASGSAGAAPSGLTVSSVLVADGEPGRVLGLIDEESDLWTAVGAAGGAFALVVLTPADRQLADRFAGLLPSPGGLFATGGWRDTPYGPVPVQPHTWAGCRLTGTRRVGWSLLVEALVERVELTAGAPLVHHRGRYLTLD